MREKPDLLDCISNVTTKLDDVPRCDVPTLDANLAARTYQQAVHEFQRGGLSGAATAEENKNLSAINTEIKMAQYFPATRHEFNITEFYGGIRRCGSIIRAHAANISFAASTVFEWMVTVSSTVRA